jgi:hypothetical protein
MTGFALLDVAIGVIFVILAFSLVASAIQEALASFLNWRGRVLRRGLFRLLEGATEHGQKLVNVTWLTPAKVRHAQLSLKVLKDPSIRSLYGPQNLFGRIWDWVLARVWRQVEKPFHDLGRMPSSIPKETFARALIDTLVRDARAAYGEVEFSDGVRAAEVPAALAATRALLGRWAEQIDAGVARLAGTVDGLPMDQALKNRLLRTLREVALARELQARLGRLEGAAAEVRAEIGARVDRAQAAIDETVIELGAWFDQTMDRVTGWYVRRAKYVLFLAGFLMAFAMNFDVIAYGGQLINSESLRNQIVARAELAVAERRVGAFGVEEVGTRAARRILAQAVDEADTSPIKANGLREIAAEEVAAHGFEQDDLAALGLPPDALEGDRLRAEHVPAAVALLNAAANDRQIDLDNDGTISVEEAEAAIDATLERVRSVVSLSRDTLVDELGAEDIPMGWRCESRPVLVCVTDMGVWFPTGLASWLLIGLGCTLGGQFWFDLLRQVVKVKTAASGLNSDLKQLTGARGGRAQGSAAEAQTG